MEKVGSRLFHSNNNAIGDEQVRDETIFLLKCADGWVLVFVLLMQVAQMLFSQGFNYSSTRFPIRATLQTLGLIGFYAHFTILDFSSYGLE
ncbi:MAG: hypothetical protein WBV73_26830 [Phormidium sp.]